MILVARSYWLGAPFQFRSNPPGAGVEPVLLTAPDHRQSSGLWWTPPGNPLPRVAVLAMHPRVDFSRHYTFPRLLAAGIGCLGANTRNPNNDVDTVHEEIVLDVAAAIAFLRERGVEKIVLVGNSGGGSLFALYQQQARCAPAQRIARTPAGTPCRLPKLELPPADALVLLSAHKGEGRIMNECIDPSVVDERDPLAIDAELDLYAARNGFRPPPTWSEYAPDFVARYRAAQIERVARLDAGARAQCEAMAEAARRCGAADFADLPFAEQQDWLRREHVEPVMVVYRTMANPNYVDRHLDPSPREYGSLLSDRPDLMNVQLLGFGRLCTPRAWLSTWSGLASNADLEKTLPGIPDPTLVIHAGADREIYPLSDAQPIFAAVGAEDRQFLDFPDARHYFEPDFGQSESPAREAMLDALVAWIRERFV